MTHKAVAGSPDRGRAEELLRHFDKRRDDMFNVAIAMIDEPSRSAELAGMTMPYLAEEILKVELAHGELAEDVDARLKSEQAEEIEVVKEPPRVKRPVRPFLRQPQPETEQSIQDMYHCVTCNGYFPNKLEHQFEHHRDELQQELQQKVEKGEPDVSTEEELVRLRAEIASLRAAQPAPTPPPPVVVPTTSPELMDVVTELSKKVDKLASAKPAAAPAHAGHKKPLLGGFGDLVAGLKEAAGLNDDKHGH